MPLVLGRQLTACTAASATTVVSTPPAGNKRHIRTLSVHNKTGAAEDVTVQVNDGSSVFVIYQDSAMADEERQEFSHIVLLPGDTVEVLLGTTGNIDVVASYADRTG